MELTGQIVDIAGRRIFPGRVTFEAGVIRRIEPDSSVEETSVILPGFVDSHVHVESSLLIPSQYARLAVRNGVVASVSDPHEIANVCGVDGVRFMIEDGKRTPLKFAFGAPSCVPATAFETAGATLGVSEVESLLDLPEVHYLAEMMNWPGVLSRDSEVMEKIRAALLRGKPVDGHAPGLTGEDIRRYALCGIDTDHECFTLEEALGKLTHGMKILIREGSAAKNFDALWPLLKSHPAQVMFCTDDAHPDYLLTGQINRQVARAIRNGIDPFDVLTAAIINPARHYGLSIGFLQVGHPADMIVVDALDQMNVSESWIDGVCVFKNGAVLFNSPPPEPINSFNCREVTSEELSVPITGTKIRAIRVIPGQLVTEEEIVSISGAQFTSQPELLKLVVKNRYQEAPVAIGAVTNFGLKHGAIASSVGHDSHNITAVGVSDEAIARAINLIVQRRGGLSLVGDGYEAILPLPYGGLMSGEDAFEVARQYAELDRLAKEELGSHLPAPFMTLSFLALLVIPNLKLSDRGLFDGRSFQFVPLFLE